MRIVSWNVNGLRAAVRKGFLEWLAASDAEVVGLQETRCHPEQLTEDVLCPTGYRCHLFPAERKGYSGVALYYRLEPDDLVTSLGEERFDREGRLQIARFGRLVIANVYFPNGSGKMRDNSRVPYKLDFYRALFEKVQRLRRGGLRVVVMGDFNTAHQEIDLARPKQNEGTSGFLPEERAELDRWIRAGWIDTFRRQHPAEGGHYTWWSQRFGVRERNVGWRIDYVLVSPNVLPFLRRAYIWKDVQGSDHAPVGVDLDGSVVTLGPP